MQLCWALWFTVAGYFWLLSWAWAWVTFYSATSQWKSIWKVLRCKVQALPAHQLAPKQEPVAWVSNRTCFCYDTGAKSNVINLFSLFTVSKTPSPCSSDSNEVCQSQSTNVSAITCYENKVMANPQPTIKCHADVETVPSTTELVNDENCCCRL